MAQKDGSVVIGIEGDDSGFRKALSGLGNVAKGAISGVTAAIGAVTTAVTGVAAASIKVGSDFESSMSQVAATMGMTASEVNNGSAEFELLKKAAMDAGASTAFSATEAAEALNYLALAGYDAETAASALPSVLNLAAAGGLDLAYASDLATDAMSALGIEASSENLTKFGDQIAKTASKANASVGQLGEAILVVGGTAKGLAGGTVELNAALGVLANRGIKGAEGGTALRNVILALSAPTDKAAKAMASLGVEAYDASGNLRPLNHVFLDLDKSMSGLSEGEKTQILSEIFNKVDLKSAQALLAGCGTEFINLERNIRGSWLSMDSLSESLSNVGIDLTTVEENLKKLGVSESDFSQMLELTAGNAKNFAVGLLESSRAGVEYEDIVEALGGDLGALQIAFDNTTGAMQTMADTQLTNLQGDLTLLKSALEGLGVSLYSEMQEPLRAAAQAATECIGQMAAALKEGGIAGLAQEAGTVLANVLTQIAAQLPQFIDMGVQVIQSLLQGLTANKDSLAASAIEIGAALISGILSILGDVAAAGAELLLALAQGVADRAPELLEQGAAAVGNLVQGLIDGAPDFFAQAAEIIRGFAESLSNSLPELIPAAVRMIGELVEAVTSNLDQVIDAGIQLALAIAEGLIAAIPDLIATIPQIVINIADIINNNAPKLLIAGAELIAQLALGLIQAIPTLIADIPKIIEAIVKAFTAFQWLNIGKSIITALGDGLKSGVSALAGAGKNIVDSIQKSFDNLPSTLANIGKNALNSIRTAISGMPKSLSQIAKSALESIKNALTGLPSTLATIGRNALSSMQSVISSLPQTLSALAKNAAEGFLSNIKSLPSLAKSAMQSLGSNIISAIKNLPTQVIEIGKNIVKGLITGIASGAADAINAVVDLAKKMIDSAKSALGIKSPSKVFAKEVGAWLPPGIGEGIEQAMPELSDDMRRQLQDLVDDANLSVAAEVGNVSGQLALSAAGTGSNSDEPKTITNENGVTVNVYYSGTSDPQDVKKISRQIGIEAAKELRRRGGT